MLELAPAGLPPPPTTTAPAPPRPRASARARVILLAGCAQQVLRPGINDSTIRLLARAASTSWWRRARAAAARSFITWAAKRTRIAFAKRNIDALVEGAGRAPVDAIVVNASGCGTTVKDYGHLLKREPLCRARGARFPN